MRIRRLLIVGSRGQLGRSLLRRMARLEPPAQVLALSRDDLDIGSLEAVRAKVAAFRPEIVVNAAAYTNVDRCETDPDGAWRVNALGPRNLAVACHEQNALLMHVSTDYVFSGEARLPYTEWDPTGPLSVYGKSKLAGEEAVRAHCPRHAILRTAWLYGGGGEADLITRLLQRARSGERMQMVGDQHGSPTYVEDLTAGLLHLAEDRAVGTYHVTNPGMVSRFAFVRRILDLSGLGATELEAVPSAFFPTPARRPACSPLEPRVWRIEGRPPLRPWEEALADCLEHRPNE